MSIKTGFAKICVTPPLGSPISGYYEKRFVKGTIDDLYLRAVAFDDGKKKSVIISSETCYLTSAQCDEYRKMVSSFCDIETDSVFITCTHTHTGPMIGPDFGSDLKGDAVYEEFFKVSMRDVAAYALADLKESKFYQAKSEAKNISFIRRFRMKDGSVKTNPGIEHPDIDHALGTPNESVKLIKIVREGANDIFMVNFGTHPDTVGNEYISGDYPGYVCTFVEQALPGTNCIFLLAPQGDVNHVNPFPSKGEKAISKIDFDDVPRGLDIAKHMARVIVGAVLSVCTVAEEITADEISYSSKVVTIPSNQENHKIDEATKISELYRAGRTSELPYEGMELTTVVAEAERILELQNGPDSFSFTISAIKIGDFVFAGIPGEPFTEIANRIYEGSPFDTTILCCLTNGGGTYFPASSAYSEGGYEARTSRLAPGGDDIIVKGMCDLLSEIK